MADTIVVPLDRSEVAERALPVARALARQLSARLHLISILEILPGYFRGIEYYRNTEPWKSFYDEVDGYLKQVASTIDEPHLTTELVMGIDPATTIHERIQEMSDPLLVISTRGRSGIKRLVLGSQVTRMVQLATYPLVVVPAECETQPESISRILVALDGSAFAAYGLNVTLDLFGEDGVDLHLLSVVEPLHLTMRSSVDADLRRRLQSEADTYLAGIAEKLTERGCSFSREVVEAPDIAGQIVKTADQLDADLIAMATHGRTGFSRLFLGSVADNLLRASTRPVLLIRPTEEVISNAPKRSTPVE